MRFAAFVLVLFLFCSVSCKKKSEFIPPEKATILSFKQNANVKTRFIYQSDNEGYFSEGTSRHIFWAGIYEKPSHRIYARLLGNSDDITFVMRFPNSNKNISCEKHKDKDITGCSIKSQRLLDNEFTAEVSVPGDKKFKTSPAYRLFIGIEGPGALSFYSKIKK